METQKHFLRRHTLGASLAGAALTVGLVAGGAAWGVSAAVADTPNSSTVATTSTSTPTPGATHHPGRHHRFHGVKGTITKIDGDTWTVHTKSGATVTVKISSSTAFGTKKTSATRASFAVGNKIGALGKRADHVVTAKRIVHLPRTAHSSTAKPTPTPGTGS